MNNLYNRNTSRKMIILLTVNTMYESDRIDTIVHNGEI